jgi:hypothetical protein
VDDQPIRQGLQLGVEQGVEPGGPGVGVGDLGELVGVEPLAVGGAGLTGRGGGQAQEGGEAGLFRLIDGAPVAQLAGEAAEEVGDHEELEGDNLVGGGGTGLAEEEGRDGVEQIGRQGAPRPGSIREGAGRWTRRLVLSSALGLLLRPAWASSEIAVRPRADWGARPPSGPGRPHVLSGLALHHTAGNQVGSAAAPRELRAVQRFHQARRGWIDVAYHLFVDAEGAVWQGRDLSWAGDTATHYAPAGWLLVCALGNFEVDQPTPAQLDTLQTLLAHLAAAHGLERFGVHRQLAATRCPGRHLMAHLDRLRPAGLADG